MQRNLTRSAIPFIVTTLLLGFSTTAFTAVENNPGATLNLASETSREIVISHKGQFKVLFLNTLPYRHPDYLVVVENRELLPTLLPKPDFLSQLSPTNSVSALKRQLTFDCAPLENQITGIEALTREADVPTALQALAPLLAAAKAANSAGRVCNASNAAPSHDISELITLGDVIVKASSIEKVIDTRPGLESTVKIILDGNSRELVVKNPPKEFLTHVGFSFLDNKDKSFYARKVIGENGAADTYVIDQQHDDSDLSYTATAIFTYPVSKLWNSNIEWGVSAGLGVDSNSVAVLAGVSLIVHKNLLFNLGVAVKEFDVLNGTYRAGQNLGESSIDSSALTGKAYKPTFGLSVGFRFGN